MKLAILISQVRLEEKLIFAAAERAGLELVKVFDKELVLDLCEPEFSGGRPRARSRTGSLAGRIHACAI